VCFDTKCLAYGVLGGFKSAKNDKLVQKQQKRSQKHSKKMHKAKKDYT